MHINIGDFFRNDLGSKPTMTIREPQIEMALEIQDAFMNRKKFICEGEVGTGKSYAYLVPGIEHIKKTGKPLIISTGTIVLQEQLQEKDIPQITEYLKEFGYLKNNLKVYMVKGKENYFCPARFYDHFDNQFNKWLTRELKEIRETKEKEKISNSMFSNLLKTGFENDLYSSKELVPPLLKGFENELLKEKTLVMLRNGQKSGLYPESITIDGHELDFNGLIKNLSDEKILNILLVPGLEDRSYYPALFDIFIEGVQLDLYQNTDFSILSEVINKGFYDKNSFQEIDPQLFDLQQQYMDGKFDRSEFDIVNNDLWEKVCVKWNCSGCKIEKCSYRIHRSSRNKTSDYDIFICNHHYLLSWVLDSMFESSKYAGLVIDEAHNLETAAYVVYGSEIERNSFLTLIDEMSGKIKAQNLEIENERQTTFGQVERFFAILKENTRITKNSDILEARHEVTINKDLLSIARQLKKQLSVINEKYDIIQGLKKITEMDIIESKYYSLIESLNKLISQTDEYVFWVEIDKNEYVLKFIPKNVDYLISSNLFDNPEVPVILTSATMSTEPTQYGFDYFAESIGLYDIPAKYYKPPISKKSPFNYANQAGCYIEKDLKYVPKRLNEHSRYIEQKAVKIFQILELTEGRALVLFTSFDVMNRTYSLLQKKIVDVLGVSCYIQGSTSKRKLLEKFSNNTNSCLFATRSFWEGIDIKGDALSCVIIDKLPFPVPDPVMKKKLAKIRDLAEIGEKKFYEMEMVLRLKQGAGRLIRDANDTGLLAIMDSRASNQYKNVVLSNLPSFQILNDITQVEEFLKRLNKVS